jgi:hypothetical protein
MTSGLSMIRLMGFLSRLLGGKPGPGVGSHDAPALEATLPTTVAARPLVVWSVAGDNFWAAVGRREARSVVGAELEASGLDPDAIAMAVAGRADTRDPPYIIWALQFGDHPGQGLPSAAYGLLHGVMHVDGTKGEDWREVAIERIVISVGNPQMVRQDRHHRGVPHIMFGSTALYGFITDDGAWASEVVLKLRDA